MSQKDLLLISISTLLTVIAWVGFNVYHASVTSTIPQSLQKKIQPIDGQFDMQIVEALKKRERIQPVSEIESLEATPASFRQ